MSLTVLDALLFKIVEKTLPTTPARGVSKKRGGAQRERAEKQENRHGRPQAVKQGRAAGEEELSEKGSK